MYPKYNRKSLAEYIKSAMGLEVSFYQTGNYWSVDIKPPIAPYGRTLSYSTESPRLNPVGGRDWWVKSIKTALATYEPDISEYVRGHEIKMWAEKPMLAELYGLPKHETEECEMSTQTETNTEEKPALTRYKFRVVETFEIYVDAADEEAAKAFIEEGVPQMQHAAFQCHDREYTVKECDPLEEDKSCGKEYRTVAEAQRGRQLNRLKYFIRKRKQYEYKGRVIPKYWKQHQYWDARLTKGANRFARDYGYLPSVISDHLRETTDFCWGY